MICTIQTNICFESTKNRDISYKETMNDIEELGRVQQVVYDIIRSHSKKGGITDQDIATITGIPLSSVNARRNELIKYGLVRDNGNIQYYDDRGHCRYRTLWVSF